MRIFLALLALATCAPAQVAEHANQDYKTRAGRERIVPRLSGPGRDARQNPRQLVEWMQVKPGMTVADLGTGPGYMLPYLSPVVGPNGKVLAQDIHRDFLRKARAKAESEKLSNVSFVLGSERDPRLPAGAVDVLLCLDSYHHFDYPSEMLAGIRNSLKPGGRFVLVEYHKDHFADHDHVRLDADAAIKEIEASGFHVISRREIESNGQYMAIFVKN